MAIKTKSYNIHDLIKINATGNNSILNSIDYQISSFSTHKECNSFELNILPYSQRPKFKILGTSDNWIFGENIMANTSGRFSLKFTDEQIFYYGDELRIPINLLIQLILLKKEHTFIHAAAFCNSTKSILLSAAPGVGKTTLISQLDRLGYTILSDDLCIIGHGQVYAYPQSLSIYPYHRKLFERMPLRMKMMLEIIRGKEALVNLHMLSKSKVGKILRLFINLAIPNSLTVDPKLLLANINPYYRNTITQYVYLEKAETLDNALQVAILRPDMGQAAAILMHEWHNYFHELFIIEYMLGKKNFVVDLISKTKQTMTENLDNTESKIVSIPSSWSGKDIEKNIDRIVETIA